MISDEERREVARRLRKVVRDYGDCPAAVICDALGIPGYGDRRDCYSGGGVLALAGMIEPTPEPTPSEWYDRGYREGMGKAEERVGRVVPVAEVKVDGERLEELVHDAVVEATGIDRDELLEEVKELERCAGYFGLDFDEDEPLRDRLKEASEDFAGCAAHIREALGVE